MDLDYSMKGYICWACQFLCVMCMRTHDYNVKQHLIWTLCTLLPHKINWTRLFGHTWTLFDACCTIAILHIRVRCHHGHSRVVNLWLRAMLHTFPTVVEEPTSLQSQVRGSSSESVVLEKKVKIRGHEVVFISTNAEMMLSSYFAWRTKIYIVCSSAFLQLWRSYGFLNVHSTAFADVL